MLGAIIGDIAGSRFEWNNIKTKEFDLLTYRCEPTDDSIMTLAIAKAVLECNGNYHSLPEETIKYMQLLGRKYPHAGYGGHFRQWLLSDSPQPYNSYGNGAAMRVSPVAYAATSLEEVKVLSRIVTEVTHNHPEGIKGAEAVAVAIYMALHGSSVLEIQDYINANYYHITFKLDDIRPTYTFDVSCQGSVPQALEAFFESTDYEDTVRNAISIGGDSDTIAAIAGSVAEAYYGIPASLRKHGLTFLDATQLQILTDFENQYGFVADKKTESGHRVSKHRPEKVMNSEETSREEIILEAVTESDLADRSSAYWRKITSNALYNHLFEAYLSFLTGEQIRYKKYFYALRPLLCCRWIKRYHEAPPMEFEKLLALFDGTESDLDDQLLAVIRELLSRKAVTEEKDLNPQMPVIIGFITEECRKQKEISDTTPDDHKHDYTALNECFRAVLGGAYD